MQGIAMRMHILDCSRDTGLVSQPPNASEQGPRQLLSPLPTGRNSARLRRGGRCNSRTRKWFGIRQTRKRLVYQPGRIVERLKDAQSCRVQGAKKNSPILKDI